MIKKNLQKTHVLEIRLHLTNTSIFFGSNGQMSWESVHKISLKFHSTPSKILLRACAFLASFWMIDDSEFAIVLGGLGTSGCVVIPIAQAAGAVLLGVTFGAFLDDPRGIRNPESDGQKPTGNPGGGNHVSIPN